MRTLVRQWTTYSNTYSNINILHTCTISVPHIPYVCVPLISPASASPESQWLAGAAQYGLHCSDGSHLQYCSRFGCRVLNDFDDGGFRIEYTHRDPTMLELTSILYIHCLSMRIVAAGICRTFRVYIHVGVCVHHRHIASLLQCDLLR